MEIVRSSIVSKTEDYITLEEFEDIQQSLKKAKSLINDTKILIHFTCPETIELFNKFVLNYLDILCDRAECERIGLDRLKEMTTKVIDETTKINRLLADEREYQIYQQTDVKALINTKQMYVRLMIEGLLLNVGERHKQHIDNVLATLNEKEKFKHIITKELHKNKRPPKQPLTFAGLFKPEFQSKLNVMFERLQSGGYIDKNNEWIIKNGTNEPAKLFHYLKDRGVIITLKFAPAIKCFYSMFGCEVVENDNGNPRATTRVNAQAAKNSVDELAFNKILLSWIDKK